MKIRIILIAAMILGCSLLFGGDTAHFEITETGDTICDINGVECSESEFLSNSILDDLKAYRVQMGPNYSWIRIDCSSGGDNCLEKVEIAIRIWFQYN